MQTINDARPRWRLALAVLRQSFGIVADDEHIIVFQHGSRFEHHCNRYWLVFGRWRVRVRRICKSEAAPHEMQYRDGAIVRTRHAGAVSLLRAAWCVLAIVLAFAGAWRAWYTAYVAPYSLPGAHGEPLPRDWRAKPFSNLSHDPVVWYQCALEHNGHHALFLRWCSSDVRATLFDIENVKSQAPLERNALVRCGADNAVLDATFAEWCARCHWGTCDAWSGRVCAPGPR